MPKRTAPVDETPNQDATDEERTGRRVLGDKGHLSGQINVVLRKWLDGKLKLDKPTDVLTPYIVSQQITYETSKGLEHPSTGAISAAMKRWGPGDEETEGIGYVHLNKGRPFGITKLTALGAKEGLDGCRAKAKAKKDKARAAEKSANATGAPPKRTRTKAAEPVTADA